MRAKALFLVLMIILPAAGVSAQDKPVLSLEDFFALAEQHSPGLKARSKQIESIKYSLKALPVWYKPAIFADLGYTAAGNPDETEHGPLARLVVEWTLWDGGRQHYQKLYGQKRADMQKWRHVQMTMELKLSLASAYYQAAAMEDLRLIYAENIKQIKRLSRRLRPQVRLGRIGYSDVADVKIKLARLKLQKAEMEHSTEQLKAQLNLLVGKDAGEELIIPALASLKIPGASSAQLKLVFNDLPAYKLARAKLSAFEADLQLTKRNLYWPTLGAEVQGGYGPHIESIEPSKPEIRAGFKFRMPLYSTRDRKARLAGKKAEIQASKLDLAQQLIRARVEFNHKSGNIRRYETRLAGLELLIKDAQKNVRRSYRDFSRGLKSSADMLAAIQTLAELKQEHLQLKLRWMNLRNEFYLLGAYVKTK